MEHHPDQVCEETIFQQIFWDYAHRIRNFLYYKCGNLPLAEDLTQEAFIRLWNNCEKVSYPKAKSFLFTVANNLFLDALKHQKVVKRFELSYIHEDQNLNAEHILEGDELKKLIEKALVELSEKQRIVFLLSRIEKMTYQEIAELLEISVKAVEKRMHKALVKLREVVEKNQ